MQYQCRSCTQDVAGDSQRRAEVSCRAAPKSLGQSLREALAGQMQLTYFPVTLDQCGAKIRWHDLIEGTFDIDDIKVSTQYLNHPALRRSSRNSPRCFAPSSAVKLLKPVALPPGRERPVTRPSLT